VFLNPKKKTIMKKLLLGIMMVAGIAGTSQASVKSNHDTDILFNAAPVTTQVEQLSTQEMKATQGEWLRFVARFHEWAPTVTAATIWAGSQGPSPIGWWNELRLTRIGVR
jgi:hypothetical protein